MNPLAIVLAATLAALVPATAFAASAPAQGPPGACDLVDCGKLADALRCVGDALGGHACHSAAAASPATPQPKKALECTKTALRNVLDGVTPMPCDL